MGGQRSEVRGAEKIGVVLFLLIEVKR